MGTRAKILQEKAQELSKVLNEWAKSEVALVETEEIQVTLCVVKRVVTVVATESQIKPKKYRSTDKQIQEEDWKRIFDALPNVYENRIARNVFQKLRDSQNEPLALGELPIVNHSRDMGIINKILHDAGLPYSLRMLDADRYKKVGVGRSSRGRTLYEGIPSEQKRYRVVILE